MTVVVTTKSAAKGVGLVAASLAGKFNEEVAEARRRMVGGVADEIFSLAQEKARSGVRGQTLSFDVQRMVDEAVGALSLYAKGSPKDANKQLERELYRALDAAFKAYQPAPGDALGCWSVVWGSETRAEFAEL